MIAEQFPYTFTANDVLSLNATVPIKFKTPFADTDYVAVVTVEVLSADLLNGAAGIVGSDGIRNRTASGFDLWLATVSVLAGDKVIIHVIAEAI